MRIEATIQALDDDTLEMFSEMKEAFRFLMNQTRAKIRQHIAEADPSMRQRARVEYLKEQMTSLVVEAWGLMAQYEDYKRRSRTVESLLTGERLLSAAKEISKLQGEIIALKIPQKAPVRISEDIIRRAREYPFTSLLEFKRNMARCPFHDDKTPSMTLFKDNVARCFSCGRSWDPIGFLMERDGLPFKDAVRALCT